MMKTSSSTLVRAAAAWAVALLLFFPDRKSTRLNSSHLVISYAVFCLKKKTQFNTMSLHRHIQASYKFDNFSLSFVDILPAQQTPEPSQWHQVTADAILQHMCSFLERP